MRVMGIYFVAILACTLAGCGNRTHANMQLAIADTIQTEPYVSDFNRFYPGTEHFISYYSGDYGEPTWNSVVTIKQKYRLTMQYQLDVDSSGKKTQRVTDPHFYLNIIKSTQATPGGGSRTSFSGGTDFGPDRWQEIIDANGDVTVVLSEDDYF